MVFNSPFSSYEELASPEQTAIVPTGRYRVPTGRVIVPAGRYIVPTGSVIVTTGRLFTTLNRQKDLSEWDSTVLNT
nr:hypothetical protein [Tanacetum cinerariifolium]